MADQVYVNVGGTWKTVNRYYVNVNGTWKTGNTIQGNIGGTWSALLGGFPTATQVASLDYGEYQSIPRVYVDSKQAISSNTLDYPEWTCKPQWTRESDFVYSPPSGGGSPPPDFLPSYSSNAFTFDTYFEWTVNPKVYTSSKTTVDATDHEIPEFTAKPTYAQKNTVAAYVPPSGGGGGSSPSILPTKANLLTLDYPEWTCLPRVHASAKSGIDASTLDYAEYQARPHYTLSA